MPSNYWLKLYHEILHDPKMIRLSDRLYRRTIELFALAGECGGSGDLPSTEDIAVHLRMDTEHLETDLIELAAVGIVSQVDGIWNVTNFEKRQSPATGAERQARFRQKQGKEQYYDAPVERVSNEPVTKRLQIKDIDIDKIKDIDVDIDATSPTARFVQTTGLLFTSLDDSERFDLALDDFGEEVVFEIGAWCAEKQFTSMKAVLTTIDNKAPGWRKRPPKKETNLEMLARLRTEDPDEPIPM